MRIQFYLLLFHFKTHESVDLKNSSLAHPLVLQHGMMFFQIPN